MRHISWIFRILAASLAPARTIITADKSEPSSISYSLQVPLLIPTLPYRQYHNFSLLMVYHDTLTQMDVKRQHDQRRVTDTVPLSQLAKDVAHNKLLKRRSQLVAKASYTGSSFFVPHSIVFHIIAPSRCSTTYCNLSRNEYLW